MPTNMNILKPPKYTYFWIWNVDNAKVIDWICTWSKLIFKSESNKYHTMMRNKKHTVQSWEIKINKIVLNDEITNTNERTLKYVKITCLTKKKEKQSMIDFGSKLILIHSLIDLKEEKLCRLWFIKKKFITSDVLHFFYYFDYGSPSLFFFFGQVA